MEEINEDYTPHRPVCGVDVCGVDKLVRKCFNSNNYFEFESHLNSYVKY